MKISCPSCHTCYDIELGLIPAEGKKLRCSKCGEVWLCTHRDIRVPDIFETTEEQKASEKKQETAPQNVIANPEDKIIATQAPTAEKKPDETEMPDITVDEMSRIFSRLKNEKDKVSDAVNKQPPLKKAFPRIKKLLGWHSRFTIGLEIMTILVIIALALFAKRFEIVRMFPAGNSFYEAMGIQAQVVGKGLAFENVIRSTVDTPQKNTMNIKGFIRNTTDEKINMPEILIEIMDRETELLTGIKKQAPIAVLDARSKIPFNFTIEVPEKNAKYIVLTFTR